MYWSKEFEVVLLVCVLLPPLVLLQRGVSKIKEAAGEISTIKNPTEDVIRPILKTEDFL